MPVLLLISIRTWAGLLTSLSVSLLGCIRWMISTTCRKCRSHPDRAPSIPVTVLPTALSAARRLWDACGAVYNGKLNIFKVRGPWRVTSPKPPPFVVCLLNSRHVHLPPGCCPRHLRGLCQADPRLLLASVLAASAMKSKPDVQAVWVFKAI